MVNTYDSMHYRRIGVSTSSCIKVYEIDGGSMELTPIQKDIIISLINLQRQKDRAIKGEEIAEVIQSNPGTIRNQMQLLKALGLVEGVPGPKGGYKPTGAAYDCFTHPAIEKRIRSPPL